MGDAPSPKPNPAGANARRRRARRKRGERPTTPPNESSRRDGEDTPTELALEDSCQAFADAVRGAVHQTLGDDVRVPANSRIEIRLSMPLGVSARAPAAGLAADIRERIALLKHDLQLEQLGYTDGRLHCHWCGTTACEHAVPPDARAVFVGYEPTGTPRWRDFTSWVIERRDLRVDRLFLKPVQPFAIASPGSDLVADLLPEFGKRGGPYRIAAQVVAGNFSLAKSNGDGERGIAVCAQIIEQSRSSRLTPGYTLNLLWSPTTSPQLPTLIAERACPLLSQWVDGLRGAMRDLRSALREQHSVRARGSQRIARELAWRALARTVAQLEKYGRRLDGRTLHARERALDPTRPTTSALADAHRASNQDIFLDRQQDTLIVRGPRQRVHVFRHDGTLITSIVYSAKSIEERLRLKRWIPLEPDAFRAWRDTLARRGADGLGETGEQEP
ncbi:MAG: hypothetical protein ACKVX7_01780 [Planctomycetota bacterium]